MEHVKLFVLCTLFGFKSVVAMVTAMKLRSRERTGAAISSVVQYTVMVGNFSTTCGLRVVESNFRRCIFYSAVNCWRLKNPLYLATAQFLGSARCTKRGNDFLNQRV
jgi:hypothetical protein